MLMGDMEVVMEMVVGRGNLARKNMGLMQIAMPMPMLMLMLVGTNITAIKMGNIKSCSINIAIRIIKIMRL